MYKIKTTTLLVGIIDNTSSLGDRRDGVFVVEALDLVSFFGEAREVLPQGLVSLLPDGDEVGL